MFSSLLWPIGVILDLEYVAGDGREVKLDNDVKEGLRVELKIVEQDGRQIALWSQIDSE